MYYSSDSLEIEEEIEYFENADSKQRENNITDLLNELTRASAHLFLFIEPNNILTTFFEALLDLKNELDGKYQRLLQSLP